jgi:hypothetical protein
VWYNGIDCNAGIDHQDTYDLNKCTGYVIKQNQGMRPVIARAAGGERPTHYLKIDALMIAVKAEPEAVKTAAEGTTGDNKNGGDEGSKIKPREDDAAATAGALSNFGIAIASTTLGLLASLF